MSIQISREKHEPSLEDGDTYEAEIVKVEQKDGEETPFGIKDQIWVTFEIEGVELTQRLTKSLNPKSNLTKIIEALDSEHFDGDTYDAEDLAGKKCRVLIKHITSENGDIWDNIDTVLKPKLKQPSTLDDLANLQED